MCAESGGAGARRRRTSARLSVEPRAQGCAPRLATRAARPCWALGDEGLTGARRRAQDLSENMGLAKLNGRLQDPLCAAWFEGLFPRDAPRSMRFSINFFTSIGLGGLTDALRAHLKARALRAPGQSLDRFNFFFVFRRVSSVRPVAPYAAS
jgi:hypothetical protein